MEDERRIDLPRQIGQEVRKHRKSRGMTQQQLAESAGVSRGFVARLERGSAEAVFPQKLLDVLDALDLSLFVRPVDRDQVPPRRSCAAGRDEELDAYLDSLAFDPGAIMGGGDRDAR